MSGTIKGIIVEIGGDTSGLEKALKSVNTATSSLTKELKSINSLLKLDPSNTELLAQKQEVLAEQIEETSKKLELLKEAQEKADETIANGGEISQENYRKLQREIIATENKLESLQNQASKWTQAGQKIEEYGTKLESLGTKISKVGNKLSILSAAVLAVGTAAVSSAIEFESAFAGVEKTVDATEEELAELAQGIKDLAEEVPATTTEIAAVAEVAGQLGIATEDILDFTKVMIDLGESTNLSADEAATALAKFANITGTAAEDYERLGSVIVELGNNFATTESDIIDMATNLASTGDLVGLTESQILALATALSSVGVEAEAGGSTMSKLLRQIQTAVELGSEDLQSFASVAGMTADEFQKAFAEDAVAALSAFIEGLNDTERNGKSAIVILNEMGITETRLTNTILSLANSNEVMSDAIETANEAWDDNTALTEEANKRYATTESQIQIVKNKFNNLATSLGNKLLPKIEDLLDWLSDLIDTFDDLTDEEQSNIIKTGLLVVAIGPLVKIFGTLTSTAGKVVKGVGTLTQAIGVLTTGTKSSSDSVNTLAKVISGLTSPIGIAVTSITAITAALVLLTDEENNYATAVSNSTKELEKAIEEQDEFRQALEETFNATMTEIDNVEKLANELSTLVDENGKVKEGYESRVSFILNELNSALGTEIELNNGVIESYKELEDSVQSLILTKRMEAILADEEEKYNEAIENRNSLYEDMISKQQELADATQAVADAEEALANADERYIWSNTTTLTNALNVAKGVQAQAQENLNTTISLYKTCLEDIANYEYDFMIAQSGTTEEIINLVTARSYAYQQSSEDIGETINQNIQQVQYEMQQYKNAYEEDLAAYNETSAEKNKIQMEAAELQLKTLAEQLISMTSTTEELTPQIVEAWKNLGTNSYEIYKEYLNKMTPEMQEEIQNLTGVLLDDENVEDASEDLAKRASGSFEKTVNGRSWGTDLVEEVADGMTSSQSKSWISNAASTVAGWIKSILGFSIPETGPLSNFDESMPDMIDLMTKGIKNNEYKLFNVASQMAEKLKDKLDLSTNINNWERAQNDIVSKTIDNTKTIYTTPQIVFNVQDLDDAKLEQCFNYVNRKFGIKY